MKLVSRIKNKVPNMAFSSDFIVGYPGETNEDFEQTLDLIDRVGFASSYSFKYSPRPGTPASLNDEIIKESLSSLRLKKIQSKLLDQQNDFNSKFIDKEVDVLITKKSKN